MRMTRKGSKVAILGLGTFYGLGNDVADLMKEKSRNRRNRYQPRITLQVWDERKMLEDLKKDHSVVIYIEDGIWTWFW